MTIDTHAMLGLVYDIKELRDKYIETMTGLAAKDDGTEGTQRIIAAGMDSLTDWYADELDKVVESLCVVLGSKPLVQPVLSTESYEDESPKGRMH
jgi:hypothetical protein